MQKYQQESHCNNPGERVWQDWKWKEERTVEKQRKKKSDSSFGSEMYQL